MKSVQQRSNGQPVCTVCASAHAEAIREALADGQSAVSVARQYGVSVDALGRHRRAGHDVARLIVVDPDSAALSLIDATVSLLNLARGAAEAEYSRGNNRLGSQVSDTALRAVGTLRDLGLDADSIKADIADAREARRKAYKLTKAFDDLIENHPELANELAGYAEARGLPEVAAALCDEPEGVTS